MFRHPARPGDLIRSGRRTRKVTCISWRTKGYYVKGEGDKNFISVERLTSVIPNEAAKRNYLLNGIKPGASIRVKDRNGTRTVDQVNLKETGVYVMVRKSNVEPQYEVPLSDVMVVYNRSFKSG